MTITDSLSLNHFHITTTKSSICNFILQIGYVVYLYLLATTTFVYDCRHLLSYCLLHQVKTSLGPKNEYVLVTFHYVDTYTFIV